MSRQVLLYPGEDGYVVAEVPSLPGCVSQGKTGTRLLQMHVKQSLSMKMFCANVANPSLTIVSNLLRLRHE